MNKYLKILPFIISFLIIIHHYLKHKNDNELNNYEKFIQIKDIDNHETWMLFFIGIGIGINLSIFFK